MVLLAVLLAVVSAYGPKDSVRGALVFGCWVVGGATVLAWCAFASVPALAVRSTLRFLVDLVAPWLPGWARPRTHTQQHNHVYMPVPHGPVAKAMYVSEEDAKHLPRAEGQLLWGSA